MTRGDDHRLADILTAADMLTARLHVEYDVWVADEDARMVTERLVEIIGEAARAMSPERRAMIPCA